MACLATSTGAEQVHVDQRVELVERHVGDLLVPQQAGVGVDGVEPAEAVDGQVDIAPSRRLPCSRRRVEDALVALGGQPLRPSALPSASWIDMVTTLAPERANSSVHASPMPDVPPVIRMTLSSDAHVRVLVASVLDPIP